VTALARQPAGGCEDCSIGPRSSAEIQRIALRQYGGAPRRRCRPHLRTDQRLACLINHLHRRRAAAAAGDAREVFAAGGQ
jgi:hypothetical protein